MGYLVEPPKRRSGGRLDSFLQIPFGGQDLEGGILMIYASRKIYLCIALFSVMLFSNTYYSVSSLVSESSNLSLLASN